MVEKEEIGGTVQNVEMNASLDRLFGFGLKYPDQFKHTHLGWIGGAGPQP